jgi:hypothetical protein
MESYKNSSSQIECGEPLEIVFWVFPKKVLLIKEIIVEEFYPNYPKVKVLTDEGQYLEILHTQHDDSSQKFWKFICILHEHPTHSHVGNRSSQSKRVNSRSHTRRDS